MKTNRFLPLLAVTALGISAGTAARANTVANASDPATTAHAPILPNQVVYKAQLPTAQEITNAAAAQGLTVEQIDQVAGRITAVYKTPNGQTMTVAYALLPNSGGAAASQAVVAPDATLAPEGSASEVPVEEVTAAPSTTVVYDGSPYYYDPLYGPYYGYYPYGVGIGLGIGFHNGYYHGGYYHGGYYRGGYVRGGYHGGGYIHGAVHGNAGSHWHR